MSKRGIYRGVYSALIDDPEFQELAPASRHLLLTMRLSNQAGPACIFRYYPAMLAAQTGYSPKKVTEALEQLRAGEWIDYDASVLWIRNGLRYDPYVTLANDNQRKGIENWLKDVPPSPVLVSFCEYYKIAYPFEGHAHKTPMSFETRKRNASGVKQEESGKNLDGGTLSSAGADTPVSPTGFEEFWTAYPKHENRKKTLAEWAHLKPGIELQARIQAAIREQGQGRSWAEGFIPAPFRWLKDRRWEDEVAVALPFDAKTASTVQAANRVIERLKGAQP